MRQNLVHVRRCAAAPLRRLARLEYLNIYGYRDVPHNNLFVSLANAVGIETNNVWCG